MSFILSEDKALKTLLNGITVTDEKNSNRAVGVWYAYPDVEERAQSFPFITIELIDFQPAAYRQHSGLYVDNDLQGTIAPSGSDAYTYEIPTTWDLVYQITTYARHPRHDRAIMAHLLNKVFISKRGYLPVPNDLGTETSYRHLTLDEFVKRDTIEDNRRLYRNVFTVTVTSEGTAATYSQSITAVSSVNINTKTIDDIPPGQQPL
ncbi:hypothetical protein UFOVP115_19 [uncultured Caudovirales phage]|uniref:Uncharacterized protein n=1 Tax=uncultured Caudovirales phage TaxID=2100421 RepID=A0A6J5L7V9_9CAUD|nr:hypothetical protein UFOVP115_19 [uncultured Caudovirales phage]